MKSNKRFFPLVFISLFIFNFSFALALTDGEADALKSAYRKYGDVSQLNILTPTVIEIPFDQINLERYNFAVYNQTTKAFEPYLFLQKNFKTPLNISFFSSDNITISNSESVNDSNEKTYVDIPLIREGLNSVSIVIEGKENISSDSLTILLDNYVALPRTVAIYAEIGNNKNIILAKTKMFSQTVNFPKTEAKKWVIELEYGQPLRITEIFLNDKNYIQKSLNSLRFLAQPKDGYQIYFDPDRIVNIHVGEAGNLSDNTGVLFSKIVSIKNNPGYVIADTDGDGVSDITDNCVNIPNKNQEDINNNGRGDVCDDFDKDGIINSKDNCRDIPNYNQEDTDGDGIGDVCDSDESRITEKYKWLPWLGIGLAGVVVLGLFGFTTFSIIRRKKDL